MQKLNTSIPNGMNKRTDIPPHIPCVTLCNDQSGTINRLAKDVYHELTMSHFDFRKHRFVATHKGEKSQRPISHINHRKIMKIDKLIFLGLCKFFRGYILHTT